ncbi:MAG: outer membrane protein assembly factor [Rhodobacteraceae bacterium]|nr:outer membrane protein assembly factor [Paracoccaceae bacterium]
MKTFLTTVLALGRTMAVAGLLLGVAAPADAFDRLVFSTPDAPRALRRDLERTSLVASARKRRITDSQEIIAAARADYGRLLEVLYAYARYGGSISIRIDGREAANISPLERPDRIGTVTVEIIAGAEFTFGQADISPLPEGFRLPDDFRTGEVATAPVVRDALAAAISGWQSEGHAQAEVTGQRLRADHAAARLDVGISLEPGPKLDFGALSISGNSRVRTERIHEIAGLPEGETYSPEEQRRIANRLRRTGAFRSVTLSPREGPNPDGALDFDLSVVEESRRRKGAGFEYSTVDGFAVSSFWLHRNLLGGAERFRIDGRISGIDGDTGGTDYKIGVEFGRPATFDPDTSLFAKGDVEYLQEPDYTLEGANAEVGLAHIYSEQLEADAAVGLRYAGVEDAFGKSNFLLLTLPMGVTWDRRDRKLDPAKGFFLDTEVKPFWAIEDGEDGTRLFADARAYQGFGKDSRVVLAARAQYGAVFDAAIDATPPDFRFYSGGGGTVRGQPYQSLGVDLGGGDVTGGRSFLGLSTELRVDVSEKIGIVGFYDWGSIGADSALGQDSPSHSGAGLGLRYATGIGPIRVDLAKPLDGTADDGYQLYIGIGQAF